MLSTDVLGKVHVKTRVSTPFEVYLLDDELRCDRHICLAVVLVLLSEGRVLAGAATRHAKELLGHVQHACLLLVAC